MITKLGLALFCGALAIAIFVVLDAWRFEHQSPLQKLQQLWEDDLSHMQEAHQLPPSWNSIREIELTPGDDQSKLWLKQLQVPVVIHKDGNFRLQIMLVSWDDETKTGAYMQYDITDLKSPVNNTVWESNRTFVLSDNEAWPAKYMKKADAAVSKPQPAPTPTPAHKP